jgi:hypothetical protein
MTRSFTINFLASVLTLCFTSAMVTADYSGTYRLIAGTDAVRNAITIPPGDFRLEIAATSKQSQYQISIKVGNSMSTFFTVKTPNESSVLSAKESIEVGGVRSTRMLPSPTLAALERVLSNALPAMSTIEVSDGQLLLEGDAGDLTFASLTELDTAT